MKRILSVILCAMMIISMLPAVAQAASSGTCGTNLTWTLDDAGTLTISGTGAMEDYEYEFDVPWYSSSYEIKSVVIEPGITSIGDWAFYYCTSLASVTIPSSVTSVGDWAFYDCDSLASIEIPEGVTSIGRYVFSGCTSLASITIPSSVTSIGDYVFEDCTSLTSIEIPEGVTSIGNYAFRYCESLASVTIPSSVTSIGSSAFSDCPNVVLQVKAGSYAETYAKDYSLEYEIKEAFVASGTCGDNLTWTLDDEGLLTISGTGAMEDYSSVSAVPWYSNRYSIKLVIIKDGVTSIGDSAFYGCVNLLDILVDNNVTNIGDYAFYNCESLVDVNIAIGRSNDLKTIGYAAFSGCSSLVEITIPESVTNIEASAFARCSNLANIYYTGKQTAWNKIIIGGNNSSLMNASLRCNILEATKAEIGFCGKNLIWRVETIAEESNLYIFGTGDMYDYETERERPWENDFFLVTIEQGITSIGDFAFSELWLSMEDNIHIPDGVTSIGDYAFNSSSGSFSVNIPDSVTHVGKAAFHENIRGSAYLDNWLIDASDLFYSTMGVEDETVVIEEGTIGIADSAFVDFFSDEDWGYSVVLPESLKYIGNNVFADCENLKMVRIPKSVVTIGDGAFSGCDNLIIYCEPGSYAETYAKDNSISCVAKSTDAAAFGTCGDNLIWELDCNGTLGIFGTGAIEDYAFDTREDINNAIICSGVTSIGNFAFSDCYELLSITIPSSVVTIGDGAFRWCYSLERMEIPSGVTSIGSSAFLDCGKLSSITIPSSVTYIADDAFELCSGITMMAPPGSYAETYAKDHENVITFLPIDEDGNVIGETYEYKMTFDVLNSENMYVTGVNYGTTDVLRNAYGGALYNKYKMSTKAQFALDKSGNVCEPYDVFKRTETADWEWVSSYINSLAITKNHNALLAEFPLERYGNLASGYYFMFRLTVPKSGKYTLSFDGNRKAGYCAPAIYFVRDSGQSLTTDRNRDYSVFKDHLIGYANFGDTEKTGYVNIGVVDVPVAGDYYLAVFPREDSKVKSPTTEASQKLELTALKLSPYKKGDEADDLVSVEIDIPRTKFDIDESADYRIIADYSRTGRKILTSEVTITSDNPAVVSVESGKIIAKTPGNAIVTASVEGTEVKTSVAITVLPPDPGNAGVIREYKTTWKALQLDKLPVTSDSSIYESKPYTRDGTLFQNRSLMNRNAMSNLNANAEEVEPWRLMDFSITDPWDMAYQYSPGGVRIRKNTNDLFLNYAVENYGAASGTILALRLEVPNKGIYNLSIDSNNVATGVNPALYLFEDDGTLKSSGAIYSHITTISPIAYYSFSDTNQKGYKKVAQVEIPTRGEYFLVFYADGESKTLNSTVTTSSGKQYQPLCLKGIRLSAPAGALAKVNLSIESLRTEADPMALYTQKQISYTLADELDVPIDEIDESKLSVEYISSNEDVATVSETGLISALSNGTTEIKVRVTYDGATAEAKWNLLVASASRNIAEHLNPHFDTDEWVWTAKEKGQDFAYASVATEPNGNRALKLELDPEYGATATSVLFRNDGHRIAVKPGGLYQMTLRFRMDSVAPAGADALDVEFDVYAYNSKTESNSNAIAYIGTRTVRIKNHPQFPEIYKDWQNIEVPISAPMEYDAEYVYITPRIVIRPSSADSGKTGYSGSFWIDDISIREVGYAGVEVTLADTATPEENFRVITKPYTTLGHYISLSDASGIDYFSIRNTNDEVISALTNKKTIISNEIVAAEATAEVTGKSGTSEIISQITLNGKTREGSLTVSLTKPVKGITLDKKSAKLERGEELTLIPTLDPTEPDNPTIIWSSSNSSVATVDGGVITAHNAGTATITATTEDGGYTATCVITVIIPVKGITLSEENISILKGQKYHLNANINPYDATNKAYSWESSDASVATVENGVITAISTGTADITVTTADGGHTATCKVSVIIPSNGIELDKSVIELEKGESAMLTAKVYPSTTTEKSVTWKSSNNNVATVENGTVVAVGGGIAKITAMSADEKYSAVCTVKVNVPADGISVSEQSIEMKKGETRTLVAELSPADATEKDVEWTSSDVRVAIVESGEIRAINAGNAVITATTADGKYSAICEVSVSVDERAPEEVPGEGEAPAQPIKASFILGDAVGRPGEEIKVPVSLISEDEINSIALSKITYDSELLEFTGFADYEHLNDKTAMPIEYFVDEENGVIMIPLSESERYEGELFAIKFRIKSVSEDCECEISAEAVTKNDETVLRNEVNRAKVNVVTWIIGDINRDGAVDIKDAAYLFQYSMLPELYPLEYAGNVDYIEDGKVDIKDAVRLFQYTMLPEIYPID